MIGTRGIPAMYGGFETCVDEISTRLVKNRNYKVIVYCRKGNYDDSLKEYKGVELIHIPSLKTKITDTFSHSFFSILHAIYLKADIFLVMNAANGLLCLLPRLMNKVIIINVNGLEWKRKKWGPIGKAFYLFSERICAILATRIISDAKAIKDYYIHRYHTDSTYIAYGADIEYSDNKKSILNEYGLKPDEYIFIASRLEPENNADIAIRAMEMVNTNKYLVIAGGANYDSDYIKKIQDTNDKRIIFLGPVYKDGHIKELHCNCFAYFHGNEVGGTNPALLKAMGYGNMIFAINNRFNKEVLGGAGIFSTKNKQELAHNLQKFLDHPKKREYYQDMARKRIKEYYTWDLITDKYKRLFDSYSNS